jgi:hypothetical protein
MIHQAGFTLRNRNPDILTCIANLSNDEVFTPPEFANRMLDTLAEAWAADNGGANIWADSSVTFLDPFTKSGVFLREITRRLVQGLEKEIPDLGKRVDHILRNRQCAHASGATRSITLRLGLFTVFNADHRSDGNNQQAYNHQIFLHSFFPYKLISCSISEWQQRLRGLSSMHRPPNPAPVAAWIARPSCAPARMAATILPLSTWAQ